jgi:pyruvate kinase
VVITAGVPVGVAGTTNLLRVETVGEIIAKGTGVGKTAATGQAVLVRTAADLDNVKQGLILITSGTDLDYMEAIKLAAAIVTEEGGLTSHAAIVAVSLSKPAVVGVDQATSLFKNGETITVDAIRGLIYRGRANVL